MLGGRESYVYGISKEADGTLVRYYVQIMHCIPNRSIAHQFAGSLADGIEQDAQVHRR